MVVYTILADGFEEVEALAVVDILKRAGMDVRTVSIMGYLQTTGAHKIGVQADILYEDADFNKCDMIFLPGGMPGTKYLAAHQGLRQQLEKFAQEEKWLAAICAAPSVLGELGLLQGRKAICYPGFESKLLGADITNCRVVKDGHIFTSKGMGTAIDLGLAIVEEMLGNEETEELAKTIQYR